MLFAALIMCATVCVSLPSLAAGSAHIGYLYKLEGYLHGQRVVYVGSAASLKERLVKQHKWSKLLGQKSTKVSYKKVYAELDIKASNRKSPTSARREALRSVEQVELEKTQKQTDKANRKKPRGQKPTEVLKPTKVLNVDQAARDPHTWQARHKVTASRRWTVLRKPGTPVVLRAVGGVLLLVEAYRLYYDYKVSRFVMAPYLLEDEHGVFTLDHKKTSWLSDMKYFKNYVAGDKQGEKVQVSKSEFEKLATEAKALWGTTDWAGDFVPGLLMPSLEVIAERA